jgi:acetylornithine deacetylase
VQDLVDVLAELIRIPSIGGTRAESDAVHYVAALLRDEGVEVDEWRIPLDDLTSRPDFPGMEVERAEAWGLVARVPGQGGPSLMFNAHLDVVPPGDLGAWSEHPFSGRVSPTDVYGRGACDMKGGVACMLLATEVLRRLEVPLRGDLVVNTVTDEESTGAGSLAVAASGLRADGGIIPEPTSLTAWLGTRGSLMPAITVEGRAGHAGFPPSHWTAGGPVNAIEKMQIVLEALQRLKREWQLRPDTQHAVLAAGSIVPTALRSGQWMVSYPADATLECHVQYVPAQGDDEGYGTRVEAEIEARVLAAAKADPWLAEHPPRFHWPGDAPAGYVDRDDPVPATTLGAMAALGLPATVASRTTFFDGPTFTRAGIPTIAFGPGDIQLAHAVDEHVPVDELVIAAQVLAVAAMRFCEVASGA